MLCRKHIGCHSKSAKSGLGIPFFGKKGDSSSRYKTSGFRMTGFSITEVLMAVGVLAVGMILIAGVFPVSIYFTTISMERTIAAVAADEAFAKIQLYGVDTGSSNLSDTNCVDFNDVAALAISETEFAYPSTDITGPKQYYWSAICRCINSAEPDNVQITVFVSRKPGPGLKYPNPVNINLPKPVKVDVTGSVGSNELTITVNKTYINDGSTVVDNATGQIYRVLERYASQDDVILLDKTWESGDPNSVWVVPPPAGGGRNPCIAVYQKEIRF